MSAKSGTLESTDGDGPAVAEGSTADEIRAVRDPASRAREFDRFVADLLAACDAR